MATFTEDPDNYPAGITVLETTDLVLGGLGEPANMQADELADRTAYLKKRLDPLLTGGMFPAGLEQAEIAPGDILDLTILGKVLMLNDSVSGPFSGLGDLFLPDPQDVFDAGLDGAIVGLASGDHSFEIVLKVVGGGFLAMSKPARNTRLYMGYGTIVLKCFNAIGGWIVVSEDTSETIFQAGMFATFPTGSSVKPGWLDCDGSTVLKADYPLLWAEIGTTYGSATATEFTLPDSGSSIDSPGTNMLWRIKF